MPDFTVEIQGASELRQALADYPKIAAPILRKTLSTTLQTFQKFTIKNDPIPYRQGGLLASFAFGSDDTTAKYGPTVKYAVMVHEGTRPHPIHNAFGIKGFTIQHPGNKGNPFMLKLRDKATPDLTALFAKAYDSINAEVSRRVNQSNSLAL